MHTPCKFNIANRLALLVALAVVNRKPVIFMLNPLDAGSGPGIEAPLFLFLLGAFAVELRGFGAFTVKHRAARQGRNPRTGDTVFVEDKFVPFFKTGKELRERLNREDGHSAG